MEHERWWVHHNLFHLCTTLYALQDDTVPSPPIHTDVIESYLVDELAMAIWGKCTNANTHLCTDDVNKSEQKLSMVLELMSKEGREGYTIPYVVAHSVGPPLF